MESLSNVSLTYFPQCPREQFRWKQLVRCATCMGQVKHRRRFYGEVRSEQNEERREEERKKEKRGEERKTEVRGAEERQNEERQDEER